MKSALLVFVAAVGVGFAGCRGPSIAGERTLPRDAVHDAIYERLGNPDRRTGSGRGFLHYDLKNGQTLTLIVSGDGIIGSELSAGE